MENMMEDYKISQSINRQQVEILTNFMSQNTDLAQGKLKASNTKRLSHNLWYTLTISLNDKGPPVRTAAEWRKVWADYKYKVKNKLRFNKHIIEKSDGLHCDRKPLDVFELSVIESAGLEAAVSKIKSSKSFGAESSEEPQPLEEVQIENDNVEYEIINPVNRVELFFQDEMTTQSEPENHTEENDIFDGNTSCSKEEKIFKLPVNRKRKFSDRNMSTGDSDSIILKEAYDVMKNLSSHCINKDDDCQIYGDYVATKLRRLNECARNTVEHMINDTLYWASLGKYDNPLPHMEDNGQIVTPQLQPDNKIFFSSPPH